MPLSVHAEMGTSLRQTRYQWLAVSGTYSGSQLTGYV